MASASANLASASSSSAQTSRFKGKSIDVLREHYVEQQKKALQDQAEPEVIVLDDAFDDESKFVKDLLKSAPTHKKSDFSNDEELQDLLSVFNEEEPVHKKQRVKHVSEEDTGINTTDEQTQATIHLKQVLDNLEKQEITISASSILKDFEFKFYDPLLAIPSSQLSLVKDEFQIERVNKLYKTLLGRDSTSKQSLCEKVFLIGMKAKGYKLSRLMIQSCARPMPKVELNEGQRKDLLSRLDSVKKADSSYTRLLSIIKVQRDKKINRQAEQLSVHADLLHSFLVCAKLVIELEEKDPGNFNDLFDVCSA